VLTSADEILGAKEPDKEFLQNLKDADGGSLFIDEAYLLNPAPKGQRQKDSNKVLNMLLKAADVMRTSTT